MKEVRFFYTPDINGELPEEEAIHATRVLRLQSGDEIMLMDGKGTFYKAEVTMTTKSRCLYTILEEQLQERQWNSKFHIAIAPTKMMERIEWMAEKATEIGIDELSFLNCKFSERRVVKKNRVEKIVISAVKQSHKSWVPVVNEIENFDSFIEKQLPTRKYIAHCYDEIDRLYLFDELRKPSGTTDDVLVMIGPEGDFSIEEVRKAIEKGFVSVSLGKSRLRTETAGITALMMMHLSK